MGKASSWRWPWLAAALAAVLLVLAYVALASKPRPPVYQGKSLEVWATELHQARYANSGPEPWKKVQAATTAIQAMGKQALPFVMADIQAHPTLRDRIIYWLAPRVPFLKLHPRKVEDRWVRGIAALEVLGPLGKPYLPELVAMVSNSTGYAESALLAVGPDALPPFTNFLAHSKFPQTGNLIGALANAVYAERIKPEEAAVALPDLLRVFQSSDAHGRTYAASALGAIHQQPDLCVPLLIAGLTNSNPSFRESCVESLGRFGEAASAHAEKLAAVFDQVDPQSRRAICGALAKFRSAAAVAVPVLVRGLEDPDETVRIWAAVGLGQLASLPAQTVPALARAVEDRSPLVRTMAVQSLGQMGPAATNVLPSIQRLCLDANASVRGAATNALIRLQ